ncbi:nucleotidyltransferase family protein [Zhouia spongiae]|uniref:Nucleotidyltransferase family protein n=1 Tax=Zhouia spongiae TaxID=2202721 RepID=A0ABY3YLL1_9FLAO|nr:nucleotidyltransferase family protein [Zhouia spongiae]UNY98731.1 nucleotidyltransferase family protein [Zhouia spongiae]
MNNIAILILAAGSSSRMGAPKQLLAVGNQKMISVIVGNAAKSKAGKIYCVLGAKAEEIQKDIKRSGAEVIYNADWEKGLGSSIAAGVKHMCSTKEQLDGILIMLSDQPKVDEVYLNNMIRLFKQKPDKIIASKYQYRYGVPALFPSAYFKLLMQLEGDKGARSILNKTHKMNVETPGDSECLDDIDTPEDYHKFLSLNSKL